MTGAVVDLTARACAAFLACAAHNGVDPHYIHRMEKPAAATAFQIFYDGTLTDQVIDSLKFCVPDVPETKAMACRFHQDGEP